MKILHYIPEIGEQLGASYRQMLRVITAAATQTESYLVTSTTLTATSIQDLQQSYHIHVVQLPKLGMSSPFALYGAKKTLKTVLENIRPDLVHLHGAWNPLLALMERTAHGEGYVTTVTVYGGMAPETLYIDFVKRRLLPLVTYQAPMIRRATSMIAINEKEWKDISSLGLKKKVEILPDVDTVRYNKALLAAYQKALDSSYRRYLTAEEETFVEKCFIAATDEDCKVGSGECCNLGTLSLRRVYFLAYDEDIMAQVLEGASKLGVTMPLPPQIEAIPRYKDRKAKRRGAIRELPLPKRRLKIPDANVDEYQVMVSILRVQKEGLDRLTFRHKMELYQIFRNLDFDEDLVGREIRRLHLKSFTKKIQKLLREMYNMPVGYNIF